MLLNTLNEEFAKKHSVIHILPKEDFTYCYGYDDYLRLYPNMNIDGFHVCKLYSDFSNGMYYIIKDNKVVHDTQFFSSLELEEYFDIKGMMFK